MHEDFDTWNEIKKKIEVQDVLNRFPREGEVWMGTLGKNIDFYFNYTDPSKKDVSAILDQMKLISIKRLDRKMYDIEAKIFSDILTKLKSFFR